MTQTVATPVHNCDPKGQDMYSYDLSALASILDSSLDLHSECLEYCRIRFNDCFGLKSSRTNMLIQTDAMMLAIPAIPMTNANAPVSLG